MKPQNIPAKFKLLLSLVGVNNVAVAAVTFSGLEENMEKNARSLMTMASAESDTLQSRSVRTLCPRGIHQDWQVVVALQVERILCDRSRGRGNAVDGCSLYD
jgi:hypothetical protein